MIMTPAPGRQDNACLTLALLLGSQLFADGRYRGIHNGIAQNCPLSFQHGECFF